MECSAAPDGAQRRRTSATSDCRRTAGDCQRSRSRVWIGRRGSGLAGTKDKQRSIRAGVLINCTGPQTQHLRFPGESPLLDNLYKSGLARTDEMNMGIDIGPDFEVRGTDGRCSDRLFAAGTLLKGTFWETTAVPELRAQAFCIARHLTRSSLIQWSGWDI